MGKIPNILKDVRCKSFTIEEFALLYEDETSKEQLHFLSEYRPHSL